MDATAEPKEKAFAKTTELVVSAWLMVVRWQSSKECNYHYNRPDVQCEVVVMDQPSIMSFDQHVVQNILQFAGGWDNWEWAITFARVSKTWRTTLENWLSQIGLEAMQGG
jgi:hypothetical protein